MATSLHHHFTIQQHRQLDQEISGIEDTLQSLCTLVRTCFGEGSQVTIRADEIACALQRFKWELERQPLAAAV